MANTTFRGPLRTGIDTGAPTTSTISPVVASKQFITSAGSKTASGGIPSDAVCLDFVTYLTNASAANITIRYGTAADVDQFGSLLISAAVNGVYYMQTVTSPAAVTATVSALALAALGGQQNDATTIVVDVTASLAGGTFDARTLVTYSRPF